MNTPKLLEPANVIRGAATEVVLQSEVLPEVPFDLRNPTAYRNAVLNHLVDQVEPSVQDWLKTHLTGERHVVEELHQLVMRYNYVLQFHQGQRMANSEFYPSRLPMDGNEALKVGIHLDGDVQRRLAAQDFEAVSLDGPDVSLDAARTHYQNVLRSARCALVRALVPAGSAWNTDQGARDAHSARLLWTLLPFAYRHIEEYVALHHVQGPVTDLQTPERQGFTDHTEQAKALLRVSEQEYDKYNRILDRLAREAKSVRQLYGEHRRTRAQQSHLGRVLSSWIGQFPAEECAAVLEMVDTERRIDRARQMNSRIHLGWSQVLALEHSPSAIDVRSAFAQVDAILIDLPTRLGQLLRQLDGDYEGK